MSFGIQRVVSRVWALDLGYRIMTIDYTKDLGAQEVSLQQTTHGPALAATMMF